MGMAHLKVSWVAVNSEIREGFLPRKFPTIQYAIQLLGLAADTITW